MRPRSVKSLLALTSFSMALFLAIVAFIYRDDIFQSFQDPGEPFLTYEKPPAPDYSLADSWLARPDLEADSFHHPSDGDAFVIVPSVYSGGEHWNLPIENTKKRAQLERIIRPNYVAQYGSAARLFAPHYRQASQYTFMTLREDARLAQNLAYQDIKRAFEFFLKESPPERPIVLAGHEQGASHVQRLLADYFQGDLKDRLAVAYIIDHPLPLDTFETSLSGLKPCETETDIRCVVSFGSFMPSDDVIARRFVDRLTVYDEDDYRIVSGRPLLCTNPLLWNRSGDYAPRRLHLGGVAAEGLDPDVAPTAMAKQTGAQCMDGILYIDKPKSRSLRRPIEFGGKFRTLPSNIFYEDLRVNAVNRVEALGREGTLPTRVEKLDDVEIIEIIDSPVTPVDAEN